MAEVNELEVLSEISTEIDVANQKVMTMSHCIKAQKFLATKLTRQAKHTQEKCVSSYNGGMKLKSEIVQAQCEIKSMLSALETIETANVELQKEYLVAKERKEEIKQHVEAGDKKYENLWLASKKRYESLPYMQKILEATAKTDNLRSQISALKKQGETIKKENEAKKHSCRSQDIQLIIQQAEFILNDRARKINVLNEKANAITDLTNKLKHLEMNIATKDTEKQKAVKPLGKTVAPETADERNKHFEKSFQTVPKLQLDYFDLDDSISSALDKVKMKGDDITHTDDNNPSKKPYFDIGIANIFGRRTDLDDISSYGTKYDSISDDEKVQNYSKKKLISILEDVKIDDDVAITIVSKINPSKMVPVETISAKQNTTGGARLSQHQEIEKTLLETEMIEDIEVVPSDDGNIVKPLSQSPDGELKTQNSQKNKKTVSIAVASTSQNDSISDDKGQIDYQNSQKDTSAVADDSFTKIKEKYNLVLSPQFVYAKKPLLTTIDDKIITSKFFNKEDAKDSSESLKKDSTGKNQDVKDDSRARKDIGLARKVIDTAEESMGLSSSKKQRIEGTSMFQDLTSGFFSYGTQVTLDSQDESMNATCFGDEDASYRHCIDSSLLLSPKADFPMKSDNIEDPLTSHEIPNFLTGLRKSGFSFFGPSTSDDSQAEPIKQKQGSSAFNFNFGNSEKKNRGGLFNMFQ